MKNDFAQVLAAIRGQREDDFIAVQRRLSHLYAEGYGISLAMDHLPQTRRVRDAVDAIEEALASIEAAQAEINLAVFNGPDSDENDYSPAQEMDDDERRHTQRSL